MTTEDGTLRGRWGGDRIGDGQVVPPFFRIMEGTCVFFLREITITYHLFGGMEVPNTTQGSSKCAPA